MASFEEIGWEDRRVFFINKKQTMKLQEQERKTKNQREPTKMLHKEKLQLSKTKIG